MKKYALLLIALIVLGGVLVVAQTILSGDIKQLMPVSGQSFGGDFTLQAEDKTIKLSDYKGKMVLVYFGYTSCPDVCPTSLAMLGAGLKRLSDEEVAQVQGIFISVDPERDQGEKLTK
ncbi:MAG: electron transport protein SCO1/SenC, partial [Thiotrichales bacterium]